jgi:hypothetical protein
MSDVSLFIAGLAVMIPAAAGIVGLLLAAIADGRENDRIQAQLAQDEAAQR